MGGIGLGGQGGCEWRSKVFCDCFGGVGLGGGGQGGFELRSEAFVKIQKKNLGGGGWGLGSGGGGLGWGTEK